MDDRNAAPTILVVEDNQDDLLLLVSAVEETGYDVHLETVQDGQEMLDYVNRDGAYADPVTSPRPNLILLDLRLPQMDGPEALEKLKQLPAHRRIPVVMLTTSWSEADIERCYDLGAASFIIKPLTLDQLIDTMEQLCRYWFNVCELPAPQDT